MEEKVSVTIDGRSLEVEKGTTVKELLEKCGIKYEGQVIIGLKMVKEQLMLEATNFVFETTKGSFVVEVYEESIETWRNVLRNIGTLKVKWSTPRDIRLGVFTINLRPELKTKEWRAWDVLVSAEGLDVENAHLIILKARQTATYAIPQGIDRLGRVSRGKNVVLNLQVGDLITSVKPMVTPEQLSKAIVRLDVNDEITEPIDIFTKVKIRLFDSSPVSAELFMSLIEMHGFTVTKALSTFIRNDFFKGLRTPLENKSRRVRGSVTIRISGHNVGSIYVYKKSCPSSLHHSVIGQVDSGIEIIDVARAGDKILIETEPRSLNLIGLTQAEASKILSSYGIVHEREWSSGDEDVIVDQEPSLTFQVLKEGRVKTRGVPASKLLIVKLYYDQAPKTVWYFKALTGLLHSKVGRLKVYFANPMIDFILFEGNKDLSKALLPENNPKDKVKPLTIGVTNMSKRFVGMVGVRLTESTSYGPTGEDFAGTNIIGEVVSGLEVLKEAREGSTIYVMEMKT
ncbi:MAG: methanogenesis marker 3 protein [Candidatus Nezhaarchaeota archaeon]|nr:methanogenesis marker 3 protein [Candidatus Nezhaarchaeota archaeon]